MRVLGIILLVYLVCAGWYFCVICNWLCKGVIARRYANPVALMVIMLLWPYALFMWVFRRGKEKEENRDDNDIITSE